MIDVTKERLIPLDVAAELLIVHCRTVYRWAVAGELEAVRCGRAWRTSREAVNRFLESSTASTRVAAEARPRHPTKDDAAAAQRLAMVYGID